MTQPAKSVFRSFESCRMRQESGCRACQDCGRVKYLAQQLYFRPNVRRGRTENAGRSTHSTKVKNRKHRAMARVKEALK